MSTYARQPAGVPSGGQFATICRAESAVTLADTDPLEERCDCGNSLEDGEGYDGLCGSCADEAEAEGRWS
jgi:hypothetical protein